MLYPWSYKAEACPHAHRHQQLLDHVNEHTFCAAGESFNWAKPFNNTCGVRAGPASLAIMPPYTASGTTLDYFYEVLKVPYVYTWEIFSGRAYAELHPKHGRGSGGVGGAHSSALLATLPPDAPRYDAVVPLKAEAAVTGGAKPLPAVQPMQPDMGANDCFAFFNPTSAEELNLVADTWADALIVASEYVAEHREVSSRSSGS